MQVSALRKIRSRKQDLRPSLRVVVLFNVCLED
jgi:hypothetical protein